MTLPRFGLAVMMLQALTPEPAVAVFHRSAPEKAEAWPAWLDFEIKKSFPTPALAPAAAAEQAVVTAPAVVQEPAGIQYVKAARRRARAAAARERAQERVRQRAARASRWEALARKRDAMRRKARAAMKLARAKRANMAMLAARRQQETARLQLRAVEAAKHKEEQEVRVPIGSVRVNVIDDNDYGVRLTVKRNGVRAHVLMAAATKRMGLQGKKLHFVHNGTELKADDPIEKYDFEDLDTVRVRVD
mmetsp:Transcript_85775/g.270355  ORF Transcript_85775/g.270355 Transcript_85775/m.270355 type:complete len:247 (+) Transcript_85775:97-837(+)